jgi:hypothetical protein
MKKLNLNNEVSDDDEKLIDLLKTSIGQKPSDQFVDHTLEKFLILETKQKKVHKPLKSPLYLILIIGLILSAPVFITFSSQVTIPGSGLELGNLVENLSFQLDSWYTLTPVLLVLVLMSVVWIELDWVKFRNPFV